MMPGPVKADGKLYASFRTVFHCECSALFPDDLPGQRQPDAGVLLLSIYISVSFRTGLSGICFPIIPGHISARAPVKPLKHMRQIFRWDSRPIVGYKKLCVQGILRGSYPQSAAERQMFRTVLKQVAHRFHRPAAVTIKQDLFRHAKLRRKSLQLRLNDQRRPGFPYEPYPIPAGQFLTKRIPAIPCG